MSALFQHAIRQDWTENNPIRAVRVSSKRLREPDILTPEEIQSLSAELAEAFKTMVMLAALTCLRVSEIIRLQWQDVDFVGAVVRLRRGVVNQDVTELKTAGSKRPLPIPHILVDALCSWQKQTSFSQSKDWVFASPLTQGTQPYWLLLQRHLQPAALRIGIMKKISSHSFRRSYASLLYANEANVKTTQELMRHSTPAFTMGVYAQAVTEAKRDTQERLALLILQVAEPAAA